MTGDHIGYSKPFKTSRLDYPDTHNEAPPQDSGIKS